MDSGTATSVADRLIEAAKAAKGEALEFEIICDCIDGVPVKEVEAVLERRQVRFHREQMTFHYRAPAELPRLVIDRSEVEARPVSRIDAPALAVG